MKPIAYKNNLRYHYKLITILDILTVSSFACISYDDSKFDWLMLVLATAAVFVGSPLEKLGYLAILLSWVYLGSLIFWNRLYKQILIMVAIGFLWVLVILQGYGMLTSTHADDIDRNHWFIGSSTVFLINSALLLFQVFSIKK